MSTSGPLESRDPSTVRLAAAIDVRDEIESEQTSALGSPAYSSHCNAMIMASISAANIDKSSVVRFLIYISDSGTYIPILVLPSESFDNNNNNNNRFNLYSAFLTLKALYIGAKK